MDKGIVLGTVMVLAALGTEPAAADVSVKINIGPPPVIFAAPPRVVVVPQTPVYQVPDTTFNVFVYGGRYFSFHDGAWFVAASHGGPWAFVPRDQMPRPVLAVPVKYYKVPPGHAKRFRDHDDHHGRGHGRDHCPPGQAKKGNC